MREKERSLQKLLLWLILLSPLSIIVFINFPDYQGFDAGSLKLYALAIAKIAGFYGVFLLLWQQILGNRFIVKGIFRDLAWTTTVHKKMGIFGILLFLLHPILMAYNYGWDLLLNKSPDLSNNFEKFVLVGRVSLFIIITIWITSFVLRSRLKYRPWKYIHYLTYLVLPIVFIHADELGSTLNTSRGAQLVWALLIATYIWAIAMRLLHLASFGQLKYKLITKKELRPGVFQYVLEPKSKCIYPKPGQFIYLRLGIFSEEHPFTIADFDKFTGNITVISKVFGKYTQKMTRLKIDTTLRVDGPYGYFTSNINRKKASVLIAGGIGITPFLQHLYNPSNKHLFLFNCNQSIKSVILRSQLKEKLGVRYVDVISENSKGKNIETGYIDSQIIKKYISKKLNKMDYYVCGPPAMMSAVKANLKNAGVPDDQVHTEDFSF